jgi:hypothetical protein
MCGSEAKLESNQSIQCVWLVVLLRVFLFSLYIKQFPRLTLSDNFNKYLHTICFLIQSLTLLVFLDGFLSVYLPKTRVSFKNKVHFWKHINAFLLKGTKPKKRFRATIRDLWLSRNNSIFSPQGLMGRKGQI